MRFLLSHSYIDPHFEWQLMQESYSHCVPKDNASTDKRNKNKRSRRICVVLRTGDEKYFEKDTGEACIDLSPRKAVKYHYGHVPGLKEGNMYTRRELKKMNAFQVRVPLLCCSILKF